MGNNAKINTETTHKRLMTLRTDEKLNSVGVGFPKCSALDTVIKYFRSQFGILRQKLPMHSNSEVYRSPMMVVKILHKDSFSIGSLG